MEAIFSHKVCPRCGEKLFDDMLTCYGCLYRFGEKGSVVSPVAEENPAAEFGPDADPGIFDVDEPDCLYAEELAAAAATDEKPSLPAWAVRVKTALSDTRVPVGPPGLFVGRAADCDVVLHQQGVSERHLRLAPAPEGVEFQDLGSTNPACLAGGPIQDAAIVSPGAAVELCGTILEVERAP